MVLALSTACLAVPGKTDQIVLVSSQISNGWQYDYYRNNAYPCSISGYQTFAIGTKVGSSPTATKPLWVKMHGGGVGWFDASGAPQPTASSKSEESFDHLLNYDTPGLMASIKAAPEGFRVLLVSMCSHDIFAGNNNTDPHNPNTTPDGTPRPTTGLIATKAAIQFAEARYPTHDYFLHGTSAGAFGTFSVAWALQQQGMGAADCAHEPLRLAIAAQGPGSTSVNMGVCVEGADTSTPCDRHVVTTVKNGVNSDPAVPADYQAAILSWVRARLADG